jgi:hypothetical protein
MDESAELLIIDVTVVIILHKNLSKFVLLVVALILFHACHFKHVADIDISQSANSISNLQRHLKLCQEQAIE